MHSSFVLIPSDYFKIDSIHGDVDMQASDDVNNKVFVLIEQYSDVWINVNYKQSFLIICL